MSNFAESFASDVRGILKIQNCLPSCRVRIPRKPARFHLQQHFNLSRSFICEFTITCSHKTGFIKARDLANEP